MPEIIDVSYQCGDHAEPLASAGVKTIIRYYSRDTSLPAKRLTMAEAAKFACAGLRIGVVHEARHGDRVGSFNRELGFRDGAYARTYASQIIRQPAGSAIYYAVDFDATTDDLRDYVIPYFDGVQRAFAEGTGEPIYEVGVYGSGASCASVLDAGLADKAWLAQSKGWAGYQIFNRSSQWVLRQGPVIAFGEVKCDSDAANPMRPDFGDFVLPATAAVLPALPDLRVNARGGLHLRAGPGAGFPSQRLLPMGTLVHPLKSQDGWTMVDLQGDGAADGCVFNAYLVPA
jgi:hypothetical protein